MRLYILLLLLHLFESSTCRGVMSCEMGGGFVKRTTMSIVQLFTSCSIFGGVAVGTIAILIVR